MPPSRNLLFLLFPLLIGGGCATYHARPLESSAGTANAMATAQREAADFNHPAMEALQFNEQDGFSPEELAVLAVLLNPQLKAERDRCAVADAQLLQAGFLPNPQLSTGLEFPAGNGSMPDLFTGGVVDLSWDITSLLTHSTERRAVQAEAESVQMEVAWQEWQAAQSARLHAYRLLNLKQQLEVARELENDGKQQLQLADRAAAEQRMTAAEYSAVQEQALQYETDRLALENELTTEESDLKMAVGVASEIRLPLQSVALDLSHAPSGKTLAQEWQGEIEQRRLDLLALRKGYASQEEKVRAAIRSQFPAINIGGTWAQDTSKVKSIGIGLSIDLPLFDRGQGRIAEERATRQQLFDEYTARVAEARGQVDQLGAQMDWVLKQWSSSHQSADALGKQMAAAETAYQEGRLSAADYFDQRSRWLSRQLDELAKQNEWMDLRLALALAAGRPIAPHIDL